MCYPWTLSLPPTAPAIAILSHALVANFGTPLRVCFVVPHSKIARYRASKTACSESDWESALKALLLGDNPGGDVQASARIGDDPRKPIGDATGYMFIDVRKKVSGTAVSYRSSRRPHAPPFNGLDPEINFTTTVIPA